MSYPDYQNYPASSNSPSTVERAYGKFAKSPLIILAILVYTCYAAVAAIQSIPMLEYVEECFEIMEESFLLFTTMFSAIFLFVGPLVVTIGLWIMLASGGKKGADTVCGGIRTYVILSVTMLLSILLFYVVELDAMDYLEEILEESYLSLGIFVFNMIASAALCAFANATEYTARNGKPNMDGVAKAGVLILITCVLNLLVYLDVFESISYGSILSSLDAEDEKLANIAQICHMAAYGLFGISALVYLGSMPQAGGENPVDRHKAAERPMVITGETWKCTCGRVNPCHCNTCVCGASRPGNVLQPAPEIVSETPQTTAQAYSAPDHIFCTKCGRKNAARAKFCGQCGNKLAD